MKNRIVYLAMMFAIFFVANTVAQNLLSGQRIFLDPGHDGFTANDRNIATIPFPAGNQSGFWESSSVVRKGLELRRLLQQHGAEVGMSRTTTPQTVSLSARMTAANNFNATAVISLHSDAFNGVVNRPLALWHTTNRHAQAIPLGNAIAWWLADNPVTQWSEVPVARPNGRAQNLAMNNNTVRPAVLIEASFHDYRPEAHRYLSQRYADFKAWNYLRGILRWRNINPNQLNYGHIIGEVREHGRLITADNPPGGGRYLTPAGAARRQDRYWVVNGALVQLLNANGTERARMTVDNNWNGIFGFRDVPPGTYRIRVSHQGYVTQEFNSVVTRGNATGHRVNLRRGQDEPPPPPPNFRLVMGTGAAGENPNIPPYGNHVTTVQAGTTLFLGIDGRNDASNPQWLSRIAHTLTSSNTAVATIATDGVITTLAAGTTTITATGDGRTGTINLTVTAPPAPPLLLNFSTTASAPFNFVGTSHHPGTAIHLVVNTGTAANPTHVATSGFTLSSSNTGVASIAANGALTLHTVGTTTITATGGGRTGTITLTVTNPLPAVNNQLTLRIVARSDNTVTAPALTVLPYNTGATDPTAGVLFINVSPGHPQTAITRDRAPATGTPTIYHVHPPEFATAAALNPSNFGGISTMGLAPGTIVTIRAENAGRSGIISIPIGQPVMQPLHYFLGTTVAAPYQPWITAPYRMNTGDIAFLGLSRSPAGGNWLSRLDFTLTSSNPHVATISRYGEINALSGGTTVIRAESTTSSTQFTLTVEGGTYHTVNFSSSGSGTLIAEVDGEPITSGTRVEIGENVAFTATPNDGHRIRRWTINGEDAGQTGNVLFLANLTANVNVQVEFELIPRLAIASHDPHNVSQTESSRPIIRIEFAQPLNEGTIEGAITVTDICGNVVPGVQTYHVVNGRSVLHFIFSEDLIPQADYTVTVNAGITGADGLDLGVPFTFDFTARPRYETATMLHSMSSLTSWQAPAGPVQTVGIVADDTNATIDNTRTPRADLAGSVRLNYRWEATTGDALVRWHLSQAGRVAFNRNTHQIEFYLFGDGSNSRVGIGVRNGTTDTGNIYTQRLSDYILVNWVGWRRVTVNMATNLERRFAIWSDDPLAANVSVTDFIIEPAVPRVTTGSSLNFSRLRAVQQEAPRQRYLHTVTFYKEGSGNDMGVLGAANCLGDVVLYGTQVPHGKDVVFTAEPEEGFLVEEWRVNGAPVVMETRSLRSSVLTDNTFILRNVTAPTTVTVVFGADNGGLPTKGLQNPLAAIQMFPNPFTDAIQITGAENSTLQVTNVLGAIVYTQQITEANENIHLGALPAGVYFFRVERDGQAKTMKVVKR